DRTRPRPVRPGEAGGRRSRVQQRRGVRRPLYRERTQAARRRRGRGEGFQPAPGSRVHRVMGTGTDIVVWLNALANGLGQLLAPIGWVPGWLSATLVAVATGVGMLAAFKYTSNQRAIKRTRQRIR